LDRASRKEPRPRSPRQHRAAAVRPKHAFGLERLAHRGQGAGIVCVVLGRLFIALFGIDRIKIDDSSPVVSVHSKTTSSMNPRPSASRATEFDVLVVVGSKRCWRHNLEKIRDRHRPSAVDGTRG